MRASLYVASARYPPPQGELELWVYSNPGCILHLPSRGRRSPGMRGRKPRGFRFKGMPWSSNARQWFSFRRPFFGPLLKWRGSLRIGCAVTVEEPAGGSTPNHFL